MSHDTYLNGARHGWPQDHSVEDAYDCPPYVWTPRSTIVSTDDHPEYYAEYGNKGEAILTLATKSVTRSVKRIAMFDTFADAQLAAEALNNLKGY